MIAKGCYQFAEMREFLRHAVNAGAIESQPTQSSHVSNVVGELAILDNTAAEPINKTWWLLFKEVIINNRFYFVHLLLKLSEPFFDTTVGPRPNLARMCG